jgi:hypothetical protein
VVFERRLPPRADVLEVLYVTRRIAGDQVELAIPVPVNGHWTRERAALEIRGDLLEIFRRHQLGWRAARRDVFRQRYAAIFFAD